MNTYTFGPFALIPDRFVLTCNGASQQLTPRLLTVLEYLIRNRNRVVTKDELITEVWNGSFIDEGIVARTVSTLRAMLADVAEKPKYIQTVSRVGYRFIHSVSIQHHDSFLLPGRNGTETTSGDPCFAGRRQELAVLKDRLMQCESGVGSIVCVSGRTGIGKTALAEKLLGAAQGRAVSARSRCAPVVSLAEPYAPFIDLFTDLLNASFDADLRQRLMELAPAWSSQAATTPGQRIESGTVGRDLTNSVARQFVAAVAEISRRQPVVLFIDDFHWADAASVDLIGFLSLRLPQLRVFLLIASRSTELVRSGHPFARLVHELEMKGACDQMPLSLLSFEEVAEYVDATVPALDESEKLVQHLYKHCEGSPFIMISALHHFKSTGAVFEADGKWCVDSDLCGSGLTPPPNVEKFLLHTIEQLDPDDQLILKIASLQGVLFDSAVLSKVSGVAAMEVEDRLRALARVYGFIRQINDVEPDDGVEAEHYRFVHALFCKALQDSIGPTRRIGWTSKLTALMQLRQRAT